MARVDACLIAVRFMPALDKRVWQAKLNYRIIAAKQSGISILNYDEWMSKIINNYRMETLGQSEADKSRAIREAPGDWWQVWCVVCGVRCEVWGERRLSIKGWQAFKCSVKMSADHIAVNVQRCSCARLHEEVAGGCLKLWLVIGGDDWQHN